MPGTGLGCGSVQGRCQRCVRRVNFPRLCVHDEAVRPAGAQGLDSVEHVCQRLRPTDGACRLGVVLGHARVVLPPVEPVERAELVVREVDLEEPRRRRPGGIGQLLDELRPGNVLRDDDVVAPAKVRVRHGQGHAPREQSRGFLALFPMTDEAAEAVDVQAEGQGPVSDVAPGER